MKSCSECGCTDLMVEEAVKCKECGKSLFFCECQPIEIDGEILWEPDYTAVHDYVCQGCGIVGKVYDSMSYSARCDSEYEAMRDCDDAA